jgi:tetratricopeptide (TPR) repeat protein
MFSLHKTKTHSQATLIKHHFYGIVSIKLRIAMRACSMVIQPNDSDSTYHDPLERFTDRETVLALFEEFLQSAQRAHPRFLALKGNSGTGKTFLIAYMMKYICPQHGWKSGCVSFAHSGVADFRSLLAGVEDALRSNVPKENLKMYRIKRDDFLRRFDEYCSTITIGNVKQVLSANSSSIVSGVSMNVQVTTELYRRERQLRAELTRALIELAEESEQPLCLFVDRYELLVDTDTEILNWFFGELLLPLIATSPQPIHIVTCGWEWPIDTAIQPFTVRNQLNDFSLVHVRDYLEKQNILMLASPTIEQQELISAFSLLTRGHPLVLGLAVTYFKQLDEQERTAEHFLQHRSLVNERARVEFLEERLLKRLSEPYRTLLERGPILRTFDQANLQALLNLPGSNEPVQEYLLDDRTYSNFVNYPFVNQIIISDADHAKYFHYSFHELIRQVRLAALRRHHPREKEVFHRKIIAHYNQTKVFSEGNNREWAEWNEEISDEQFKIQVEILYHALQVNELREQAFETWGRMIQHALAVWHRQQSGLLLELARQLSEEDEPFFRKQEIAYGFYSILNANFLTQENRWEEAKKELEQALHIFEQRKYSIGLARVYQELGQLSLYQGKLDDALAFYEHALTFKDSTSDPFSLALIINGIGAIYLGRGRLKEAHACFEQIVTMQQEDMDIDLLATAIHNIGSVYRVQGQTDLALEYFVQALALREKIGNPTDIANSLNNIGGIYDTLGKLTPALEYYEHALNLREQIGNPIDIATSLNNIGLCYKKQEKLAQSRDFYSRALALREQIGNPIDIANSCNNLAHLYLDQLGISMDYTHSIPPPQQSLLPIIKLLERALTIYTKLGQGFEPEVVHELEMLSICSVLSVDKEKALSYAHQARLLRRKIQFTSERDLIDGNSHQFFAMIDSLLESPTERYAYQKSKNTQETGKKSKKKPKKKHQRRKH